MDELIDISKDAFVENGLDIWNTLFDEGHFFTDQLRMVLDPSIGSVHSAFVQYLNDTGHAAAAQALDDAWHEREDQWWREPDGFDTRYKHGDEKRREIFGPEETD